jgi:creatinine amidohydrolase
MQHGELRWTQTAANCAKVMVVPLGSLEQHGHHLPMLTDTWIISEVARRAEAQLGEEALFLPTLWLGASDHHRAYPGTVSVANAHYVLLLEDILESLIGAGFRRIFLLNGHGGNITPARQAIYNVQIRHRAMHGLYLAFSSWWTLAQPQIAQIATLTAKMVTHACEQETSMILRLRPELVRMDKASGAVIPFESAFYSPDFSGPGRVEVARTFDQLTITGAFGHPELATPEKGEALYAAAAGEVVAFVREFSRWSEIEPS